MAVNFIRISNLPTSKLVKNNEHLVPNIKFVSGKQISVNLILMLNKCFYKFKTNWNLYLNNSNFISQG